MNKIAIAVLLAAGTLISYQAHAGGPAIVGAVEGAIVGAHFGGAHGAVAGAIFGAALGSATESDYDRRYREPARYEREAVRYSSAPTYYASPAPTYYASPAPVQPYYEPYYETYYEPRRVVYVQPRVYDAYPVYYPAPVYVSRYAGPSRAHYSHRRGNHDYRGRY